MQRYQLNASGPERAQVLANALAFLQRLPAAKSWRIEIKEARKERSGDQNAALWGVPDGWVLVPEDIHPRDEIVDCSGIRNALNQRPGFRLGFSDELSLIACWWEQITDKAPQPTLAAAPSAPQGTQQGEG